MEQDKATPGWFHFSSSNQANQTFQLDENWCFNGSPAPEEAAPIKDISQGNGEHSQNVDVVKPYAIEEPDQEEYPSRSPHPAPLSPHRNSPDAGQGDLVGSMEELHCGPDHDPHPTLRRGKKRKPSTTTSGHVQHRSLKSLFDVQYEPPTLSPKRQRRRSKRSGQTLKATHSPYKNRGFSGSSGSSLSMDTSTANLTNGCVLSDEMEID